MSIVPRYSKESDTQLQWKFEEVLACEDFPNGVKTSYRAFAEDEVVEIVRSPVPADTLEGMLIGLKAIKTKVEWFPTANPNGRADGMFILKSIPKSSILPAPFIEGSSESLQKILSENGNCCC